MIFNMTGGANPLNFYVKTYPSETELKADKPKGNTIGVITTTTMTSWVFSATEPKEPEVGMVWITVGSSSGVEFNALKKNTLQVYPLSAKQYVSGKWEEVKAMSYQDDEWESWTQYLYNAGDMMEEITGGYVAEAKQFRSDIASAGVPTIATDNPGKMVLYYNGSSGASGIVRTAKKINLTGYSTLHFDGSIPGSEHGLYGIFVWTNIGNYIMDNVVASVRPTTTLTGETSVSLEGVTGECYIGFAVRDRTVHLVVERMWLG